jgi:raffinose/stachyose/melibiose transport system substrate-binding protein
MKSKRTIIGGLVLLSLSILLCSCSYLSPSSSSQPEHTVSKITTLDFIYAGGDATSNQAMGEVVDAFNKSHGQLKINGIPSTSGAPTYDEYLKRKVAVGEFPDIVDMWATQTYADAGKIAPLPQEIAELIDDPAKVNGIVYTAPLTAKAPLGIIYNKELFAKAGILKEPESWEEFLDICEQLKSIGITPIVVAGKDLWHMGFWQGFFMGNEIYAANPDWNADKKAGKVQFTDANVVRAMKDMTELWTRGYVNEDWLRTADNEVASRLVSGKVAMVYEGSWMFNTIKQLDPNFPIGFFAPRDRNGRIVTIGKAEPAGIALSTQAAEDPYKVAAFGEFMRFFYRSDIYTKYLQVNNGLSTLKERITYEAPEEMKKLISIHNDPRTVKVMMMHAYWGENKISSEFRDWLWVLTQEWLSSEDLSIEEAMKQADVAFDRFMP